MKNWETLYKERGIIQKKPSKFVIEAVEFFKKQNLEKILDLGCGTGRHTAYLIENGFKVYGCDHSKSALDIAKKRVPGVEFKQCDMTNLPYKDESFDGVLCHFVLQHGRISDIKRAISEIRRVLKNNGILYLSVPSTEHPEYSTGKEIEYHTKIGIDAIDGDIPHHYFTEDEIKQLFSGFQILKLMHVKFRSEKDPNKKAAAYILYARKIGRKSD